MHNRMNGEWEIITIKCNGFCEQCRICSKIPTQKKGAESQTFGDSALSSIISLVLMFGFIWLYRQAALQYWPLILNKYANHKQLLYLGIITTISYTTHIINFLVYGVIDKYNLMPNRRITKTGFIWETDKQKWRQLRNKSIKLNLINIGIIGFLSTLLDSFYLRQRMMSYQIPEYLTIFGQFFFFMMVQALLFYVFHKIGHLYLYNLHKVHHQFHIPTLLASTHFHPIDYFLGVIIPVAAGPKLIIKNVHIVTLSLWFIFRICEGHDGHSNYQIPWSPFRALPLSTTSEYHSFHHTHNQGNFGSTDMIPDTAFFDNQAFFKYKQSKQSKQQKLSKEVQIDKKQ